MPRGLLCCFGLIAGALSTVATLRAESQGRDKRAAVIGQPVAVTVEPKSIALNSPRSGRQILITARYTDGSFRDLTRHCQWKSTRPGSVQVSPAGYVTGLRDGAAQLQTTLAGFPIRVSVTVAGMRKSQPISFYRELMPVLSKAGCSDIRCHGAPSGKNGFRLSLWGADPVLDFQQLTHDVYSRRTNAIDPEKSLILKKALASVSHVGGRRFGERGLYAGIIRTWQSEGCRRESEPVGLRSLVVTPSRRVLKFPAKSQQLSAVATFDDGGTADVTRLTTFSSSDLAVATVDRNGLVKFKSQGDVAVLCRFLGKLVAVRLMHVAQPAKGYRWPDPVENNFVDRHVYSKLKMLNIAPATLCSDEQFIRRVTVDLCGILPTPRDVRAFTADKRPDKRYRLVDRLLQRPEFGDLWTKKWMDVLRVSRDSIQWAGSKAFRDWMRKRIQRDDSFAAVVRDMLASTGKSYSDPAVNFYCVTQVPKKGAETHYLQKDLAEATAQLFMGVRLQCAKCHNHPFERWTQHDYLALAAHFTQIKRTRLGKAGPGGRAERRQIAVTLNTKAPEIVNVETGKTVLPQRPGERVEAKPTQDRRVRLANWLTGKDNPFFARSVVNRVWFHLHGRGIVDPVDDFRDSNPSVNDPLLDALAAEFVVGGFRLKPLIRTIVNSRTYQHSAVPARGNNGDGRYFSYRLARPLHAEVLLDAICDVTGVPEKFQIANDYTIGVPKGFVKLPPRIRAVQLPANDIVTLINQSSAYVRYESHPFLRAFGQPTRTQTCECDREQTFGRKQALEVIIGKLISDKLASPDNRLNRLLAARKSDRQILDELYLRTLARRPSKRAAKSFLQFVSRTKNKRQAWEDVLWTLLNSQEFLYQH